MLIRRVLNRIKLEEKKKDIQILKGLPFRVQNHFEKKSLFVDFFSRVDNVKDICLKVELRTFRKNI